jgi:hypothetical protein
MWQHQVGLHNTKVYMNNVSLKYYWDTCTNKCQTIAVAQYIGSYKGGFDLPSEPYQYGTGCAK